MEAVIDLVKPGPDIHSQIDNENDIDAEMRRVFSSMKASELPLEEVNEFSDAPFEFAETAKWLWDDTRVTYYHAGIENRYSENYLKLCGRLEKNIRKLGSCCLSKAVMEQKGYAFPGLDDLDILSLVKMVSCHLRKCHAAFQGCYYDNNFLGMTYLNWEFRWFDLGNRLKATGVKIDKIRSGEIKADSLLEQTEKYKGEPRTNDKPGNGLEKSLRLNPSALPLDRSMAREMLRVEKEQDREAAKKQREAERSYRGSYYYTASPFGPPKPFPVESSPLVDRILSRGEWSPLGGPDEREAEDEPETYDPCPEREPEPGELTPEEAREKLLTDARERNDQEALKAIPGENIHELHERWERYCDRVERAAYINYQNRAGPSQEKRKKLREKRKKRR